MAGNTKYDLIEYHTLSQLKISPICICIIKPTLISLLLHFFLHFIHLGVGFISVELNFINFFVAVGKTTTMTTLFWRVFCVYFKTQTWLSCDLYIDVYLFIYLIRFLHRPNLAAATIQRHCFYAKTNYTAGIIFLKERRLSFTLVRSRTSSNCTTGTHCCRN